MKSTGELDLGFRLCKSPGCLEITLDPDYGPGASESGSWAFLYTLAVGILADKTREAERLNRELARSQRLLNLPSGGTGPRGASVVDVRGLRNDIRQLGSRLGGDASADPFLTELSKTSGPRRAG